MPKKTLVCPTTGEAMKLYHKAAERLLYVTRWDELTGQENFYTLLDNRGKKKTGIAAKGDYIQVKKNVTSLAGKDELEWLVIEKVLQIKTDDLESTAIRVRYTSAPTATSSTYFKALNTNTFIVERHGHAVRVDFHPHHEVQDNDTESSANTGVNHLYLLLISWLGISRNKWEDLIDGLLMD
jgi:hypothetical protein